MGSWHEFFSAEVGASAALAGLLFVALSINIAKIIEIKWLPNRAAQSLVVLLTALLVASLALFPESGIVQFGLGSLAAMIVSGIFSGILSRAQLSIPAQYRGHMTANVVLNGLFYAIGLTGATLTALSNGAGVYLLAAAILYALCYAMFNAWVLLVEILR